MTEFSRYRHNHELRATKRYHGKPRTRPPGCDNLFRAVRRARPLLHCFGHIREGDGAEIMAWKPDPCDADRNGTSTSTSTAGSHSASVPLVNQYSKPTGHTLAHGQEFLMINATIRTGVNEPGNAPWSWISSCLAQFDFSGLLMGCRMIQEKT